MAILLKRVIVDVLRCQVSSLYLDYRSVGSDSSRLIIEKPCSSLGFLPET